MSMVYDRPHRSYEGVSDGILAARALYELEMCNIAQQTSLPDSGDSRFRLVSWVEANNNIFGYGLALSKPDFDKSLSGHLYRVMRLEQDSRIVDGYPKVLRAGELQGEQAAEEQLEAELDADIEDLTLRFDRDDLIAILGMLYKAANIFMGQADHAVDHEVNRALINSQVANLGERERELGTPTTDIITAKEHILEWHEFIGAAQALYKERADSSESHAEVAVEHEHANKFYAINLIGDFGQLTGLQILRQDRDRWRGRVYNFDPAVDEDDIESQQLDPACDKDALMATLQGGLPIPRHQFQYYLSEALE